MIEMVNETEILTESTISSVTASTPERCDSIVTVTVSINRKPGDTNLRIEAVLKDSTKVKFVGNDDNSSTVNLLDNVNQATFQVRNVTNNALANAIVFSSIALKRGIQTLDTKTDRPTVTWPACPAQPCDDCCKCDCSSPITVAKCDAVTDFSIDTTIKCSGRILKLTVNIKNVCPGRKIALAAFITENDVLKGVRFKEVTSGGTVGDSCKDVTAVMCFVLPDSVACADARTLKAHVIANYEDLGNDTIPCCCS